MLPPSRSWKNRRENLQRDLFVGRSEHQHLFAQNFDVDEFAYLLFSITGEGGVGKSTLIKRFEQIARKQFNALVITCDDRHTTPVMAMGHIATELGKHTHKHRNFDERYSKYRELLQQIEGDPKAPRSMVKWLSLGVSDFAIRTLRTVPGVGIYFNQADPEAAAEAMSELVNYSIDRLGNKDEVQLLREPEQILTPLFVQLLSNVCQQQRLVLIFDVFERTAPGLSAWLRALLDFEYGDLDTSLTFIISGRDPLEQHWTALADVICHLPLEPFTEQETRQYLSNKGITDEALVTQIHADTAGLPVLVELLAATNPQPGLPLADVSHDAVERFLQWTPLEQRSVALLAAVPRQFNLDILNIALDQDATNVFTWLSGQSYVRNNTERGWFYHEKVRELMLRHLHHTTPSRLRAAHNRLTHFFARTQQLDLPIAEAYSNATWYQLEAERLYHALHERPERSISEASNVVFVALRWRQSLGESLIQLCQQVGHEMSNLSFLEHVGKLHAISQARKLDLFTDLLKHLNSLEHINYLNIDARAAFYVLRGISYSQTTLAAEAIENFTQAITLQPDESNNYYWRGRIHYQLKDYASALTDLTQAITLQPDESNNYRWRGGFHYQLKDYASALTDLTQAITLQPDEGNNYRWRGLAHYQLKDYASALADLTQAIRLKGDDTYNYYWRGRIHYELKDYTSALTDLNQAITLQPDNAYNYYWRGRIHYELKDYASALTDLTQAITLQPDDTYNYYWRGRIHYQLKDYASALTDLNQAITLQPDNAYNYYWRGGIHYGLKDYASALTDLNQAITLQPNKGNNYFGRGLAHYQLKDYASALTDLTQAITLQPDDAYNYYWRGRIHYQLKDYASALTDLTQAITLRPDNAYNYYWRGRTKLATGSYMSALFDFTKNIELASSEVNRTYYWRAITHLLTNNHDNAQLDLSQAITIATNALVASPDNSDQAFDLALYELIAGNIQSAQQRYEVMLHNITQKKTIQNAIKDLDEYLNFFPDNETVQAMRQQLQGYLDQYSNR